jgi:hypothetical protein
MRPIKSERLRKLEIELQDLEQWLKLGLVPKKDIEKHKEEIAALQAKIEEEKERLQFLKESGEAEEYVTPKKQAARAGYTEMPSIPDIDVGETGTTFTDAGLDMETEVSETASTIEERDEEEDEEEGAHEKTTREESGEAEEEEEEESYFSDKNRWRRGGIVDPDANDW